MHLKMKHRRRITTSTRSSRCEHTHDGGEATRHGNTHNNTHKHAQHDTAQRNTSIGTRVDKRQKETYATKATRCARSCTNSASLSASRRARLTMVARSACSAECGAAVCAARCIASYRGVHASPVTCLAASAGALAASSVPAPPGAPTSTPACGMSTVRGDDDTACSVVRELSGTHGCASTAASAAFRRALALAPAPALALGALLGPSLWLPCASSEVTSAVVPTAAWPASSCRCWGEARRLAGVKLPVTR